MTRRAAATLALLAASVLSAQPVTPPWTRGATCYEIFVRSFADSDGDGIGDLRGLTARLDYINDGDPRTTRDLGARCVWLMPVAESPSYHGYDVTDYYRVDREYGTNEDFRSFVAAAHRRGIKVLVDMVLNHTSSEHPWFQSALRDSASRYRDWYRWRGSKPTPNGASGRALGHDAWHRSPLRDEYYYGVFWHTMPDLDHANPAVRAETRRIARYWVEEMGVDGFRLDAVAYLAEDDSAEVNARATHDVLRGFGAYVGTLRPRLYAIGEVWGGIDTLRTYYPDQLTAYFAFDVADSLAAAVRRGTAGGVLAPALAMQRLVAPATRYAPFLSNHDRERARTAVGGSVAQARVAALLLLTLPGLPFVYYGDEIGMVGSKPDERLRTPMQWRAVAGQGFTTGTPWERAQDDSLTTTVAAQDADPGSLLSLHRRLIHLRAENGALAGGTIRQLATGDSAVVAYVRRLGARAVIVVANVGSAPAQSASFTAAAGTLPPGRWRLRPLLGAVPNADVLAVDRDGSAPRTAPFATLPPRDGAVLELVRW